MATALAGIIWLANIARSTADAPEIDGLVYIQKNENIATGDLVKACVTDADEYDLYAELD